SAKALHQIKRRAVDLNRINCRPAMEPLAPPASMLRALLPHGISFLEGHSLRFCLETSVKAFRSRMEIVPALLFARHVGGLPSVRAAALSPDAADDAEARMRAARR